MEASGNDIYVNLPWNDNTNIIYKNGDQDMLYRRWNLIKLRISSHIEDVDSLIDVIRSYNVLFHEDGTQSTPAWSFKALRDFVDCMEPEQKHNFFRNEGILHSMQNLALTMPETCAKIKMLASGREESITLHQMQVACILANAFFCTFPRRGKNQPSINFNSLFEGGNRGGRKSTHVEKLKCIIHYFCRIHEKQPSGFLSFYRRYTPQHEYPRWERTNAKLCSIAVDTSTRIEDQADHLQMDFANRVVGGGVLGWGCVQEEIRFVICPELIAARLFTEPMVENEALVIIGAERFCNYGGYSDNFYFDGDHEDQTPVDSQQRRSTHILAVDALSFSRPQEQYREGKILREIKKVYTGLAPIPGETLLPLATGNWGCGVYHGDPQLKALLQIMAASQVGRRLSYSTFGDQELKEGLLKTHGRLCDLNITVGQLYRILTRYIKDRRKNQSVFHFVLKASSEMAQTYSTYQGARLSDEPSEGTQKRSNAPSTATGEIVNKQPRWDGGSSFGSQKWTEENFKKKEADADLSRRFNSSLGNIVQSTGNKDVIPGSEYISPSLFSDSAPFGEAPVLPSNSFDDSDELIPCTPQPKRDYDDILKFYSGVEKHKTKNSCQNDVSTANSQQVANETSNLNRNCFIGDRKTVTLDSIHGNSSQDAKNYQNLPSASQIEDDKFPNELSDFKVSQSCPNNLKEEALHLENELDTSLRNACSSLLKNPTLSQGSIDTKVDCSPKSTAMQKKRFSQTTMDFFLKK